MEKKADRKQAGKALGKKGKKRGNVADERFAEIQSDPRFDSLPTKKRKVVIDERFKGMLSDQKFGARNLVDMRGRRVNLGTKNTLKELYDLEKSEASSSEGTSSEDEGKQVRLDLARGDGNVSSSDDESGEEWDLEEDEVKDHGWGELDRDARRVEWASRRLALCNMEWDRVTASDIFVLLSSFKPPAPAEIQSVTIYLSDFGKERLKEEEKSGPRLPNLTKPVEEGEELDTKTREALRAYQLDRMRYYYAIIECNSEKTASVIYESCDGVEFESSSIRMDLRFVPDGMAFEENMVKEKATEEGINLDTFKPKNFESSALSKSSTKLTWDETDPERIKALREAFDPDADLDQLQHLIAPASSDEDDSTEKDKARVLLEAVEGSKNEKDSGIDVKWEEPGTDLVEDESGKKEKDRKVTPWEKYLEKRKAKRKERKAHIAELKKKRKSEMDENEEKPELPVSKKESSKPSEKVKLEAPAIEDERFAALYSNSAFAIDQSNPLFKSKNLAIKQANEKQKLRVQETNKDDSDSLVEKIKRKAEKIAKPKS